MLVAVEVGVEVRLLVTLVVGDKVKVEVALEVLVVDGVLLREVE